MDILRIKIVLLTSLALNIQATLSHEFDPSSPLSRLTVRSSHNERRAIDVDGNRKFHNFVTRPDIEAPIWNIEKNVSDAQAEGHWFVALYQGLGQDSPGAPWLGPHIYDKHGELVWSGATAFKHWNIFDFQASQKDGQPILTMLSNHEYNAYILNEHYQVIDVVDMNRNKTARGNMHAFHVIEDGRKAIVVNEYHWNTTEEVAAQVGFHGSCKAGYEGYVICSGASKIGPLIVDTEDIEKYTDLIVNPSSFTELDLTSDGSKSTFEWNARYHIGLDEVTWYPKSVEEMCSDGWDVVHLNAIDKFPDGDFLLSSRHTSTLYKISHVDGHIIWRLGGKKSDFKMIGDSEFSRQHHGRVRSQSDTHIEVTLFDNTVGEGGFDTPTNDHSRGLVLSLDLGRMEAETVVEYPHPQGRRTVARGSFQTLPNGSAFLCWAWSSRLSEYTADGEMVLHAALRVPAPTYRAFKYLWVGQPLTPPDVYSEAVWWRQDEELLTMIYVSWNGATEVAWWEFNKVDQNGHVELIEPVARTGFETKLVYHGSAEYVLLEAFDKNGHSLGESEVVRTVPATSMGVEFGLHASKMGESLPVLDETQESSPAHTTSPVDDTDNSDPGPDEVIHELPNVDWDHELSPTKDSTVESSDASKYLYQTAIASFLVGVGCSVILLVIAFFIYSRKSRTQESGWGVIAPKYAPVKQEDEEYELRHPAG